VLVSSWGLGNFDYCEVFTVISLKLWTEVELSVNFDFSEVFTGLSRCGLFMALSLKP